MLRSPQTVISACLLRTHRSLQLPSQEGWLPNSAGYLVRWRDGSKVGWTTHEDPAAIGRQEKLHCELPRNPGKGEGTSTIPLPPPNPVHCSCSSVSRSSLAASEPFSDGTHTPAPLFKSLSLSQVSSGPLVQERRSLSQTAHNVSTLPEHSTLETSWASAHSKCLSSQEHTDKSLSLDIAGSIRKQSGQHQPALGIRSRGDAPASLEKSWTPCLEGRLWSGHQSVQVRGFHRSVPQLAALGQWLSVENEARCRQRLQPNAALYDKDKGKSWASVLVSLCSEKGEPSFLFTLRSSKLKGRHKGDVSFAGGKRDPSDQDVVETALREAREELGVAVAADQVWGVMKPLRDRSGMLIAPVLANLGPLEALAFRPNPGEVEEIFTLSLAHVCNPQNRGYTHFRTGDRYGYTLPVFRNGKHRVWGLTAMALDHTLKLIVPQ